MYIYIYTVHVSEDEGSLCGIPKTDILILGTILGRHNFLEAPRVYEDSLAVRLGSL